MTPLDFTLFDKNGKRYALGGEWTVSIGEPEEMSFKFDIDVDVNDKKILEK
jgi:hypothetical protein